MQNTKLNILETVDKTCEKVIRLNMTLKWEEGKDKESMQSSTTPGPGYRMGK